MARLYGIDVATAAGVRAAERPLGKSTRRAEPRRKTKKPAA